MNTTKNINDSNGTWDDKIKIYSVQGKFLKTQL